MLDENEKKELFTIIKEMIRESLQAELKLATDYRLQKQKGQIENVVEEKNVKKGKSKKANIYEQYTKLGKDGFVKSIVELNTDELLKTLAKNSLSDKIMKELVTENEVKAKVAHYLTIICDNRINRGKEFLDPL